LLPEYPIKHHFKEFSLFTNGDYLMTESMNLNMAIGVNKFDINRIAVFRIDLSSFPTIWTDFLTLQIDLLILVDPVERLY
jgi:hypothetical protein